MTDWRDGELEGRLTATWAGDPDPARMAEARAAALAAAPARPRRLRTGMVAAAVVATTVWGGTSAAAALTADALPGGPAYTIKRTLERLDVALAFGSEAETRAWLEIAETRLQEAERACDDGRADLLDEILGGYTTAADEAHRAMAELASTSDVLAASEAAFLDHVERLQALLVSLPEAAEAGVEQALAAAGGVDAPATPSAEAPPAGPAGPTDQPEPSSPRPTAIPSQPVPSQPAPSQPAPAHTGQPGAPPPPTPTGSGAPTTPVPDDVPSGAPEDGPGPGRIPEAPTTLYPGEGDPPTAAGKGEGQ